MKKLFFIFIAITVLAIGSFAQKQPSGAICSKIKNIKELPRDPNDVGVDKAYDSIVKSGKRAVPCLIDLITDTTITHDPRCPTINQETKIGDVAFFVLARILEFEFTQFFPDAVRADFKTNGIYAYEGWIEKPGSRSELQMKIRNWYAEQTKSE
ncbi:MAG: hypothetical protein JNL64_11140 [Blastocatellia bacterium]|nr:hypothetical protein [Blastocatellia bacterium]